MRLPLVLTGPALALALVLVPAGPAAACRCAELSFEEARDGSTAIFEGIVESITAEGDRLRVRFAVTQAWRGVTTEHAEVTTSSSSASCGYTFEVGTSYLVYASGDAPAVSLCSRTRPMDEAGEDRRSLGSGVIPVEVVDEAVEPIRPPRSAPTRGGCASCSARANGSGGGLAVLALALALALRRARP